MDIPNVKDKDLPKIEHEIDMTSERHVFQIGERVKILKLPDECMKLGLDKVSCDIINKIGTIQAIDGSTRNLFVVLDHLVNCHEMIRNTCQLHESNVESMRSRVIFSIHQVEKTMSCESKSCDKQATYIIFEYVKGNSFQVCPTHAIEWLNLQYRQLADVVIALNKQMRK